MADKETDLNGKTRADLQRLFAITASEPETPRLEGFDMKAVTEASQSRLRLWISAAALILVAAAGVGLGFGLQPRPSGVLVPATSGTPSPTSSPLPVVFQPPGGSWQTYCSSQEKGCFSFPNAWSFSTKSYAGADAAQGDSAQLTSPAGTRLVFRSTVSGIGGGCNPNTDPHYIFTKVTPLASVPGLYMVEYHRASDTPGTVYAGLVDSAALGGRRPALGDTGTCIFYALFVSHHDPNVRAGFGSWSAGVQSIQAADLPTVERILQSYSYTAAVSEAIARVMGDTAHLSTVTRVEAKKMRVSDLMASGFSADAKSNNSSSWEADPKQAGRLVWVVAVAGDYALDSPASPPHFTWAVYVMQAGGKGDSGPPIQAVQAGTGSWPAYFNGLPNLAATTS